MDTQELSKTLQATQKQGLIIVVVALYLCFPVFTPVHVEGFSATIQSIAIHLNGGDLANYDSIFPFNLEFYFNSRFGMNLFVAKMMQVFSLGSEMAMTITMYFGFLLLVFSSAVLIRRWANTDWTVAVFVLLLVPGVTESAFYYNDNILSSGIAVTAIALCTMARNGTMLLTAGVLLGGAILVRPDNIILLAAICLILWMTFGSTRRFIKGGIQFSLGLLSILVLAKMLYGVDFFRTMDIANYAVSVWNNKPSPKWHIIKLSVFLGIPGLVFISLGILQIVRNKDWSLTLLLMGLPLIYNLAYFGKLTEARYVLPLTPFLGALAAQGIRGFTALKPPLRVFIVAGCFLIIFAPPFMLRFFEGPRSFFGRMWAPFLWQQWQADVREDFQGIDNFVANLKPNTIVITDDWNIDRYMHLAMQTAGYQVQGGQMGSDVCRQSSEIFQKNGNTVFHLRLHTPMLKAGVELLPLARFDAYAPACVDASGNQAVFFYTTQPRQNFLLGNALEMDRAKHEESLPLLWLSELPRYQSHVSVRLEQDGLESLRKGYVEMAASALKDFPTTAGHKLTLAESERALESRLKKAN